MRSKRFFLEGFDVDPETGEIVDLVIGTARDGQILEVFVHRRSPHTVFIFHVLHFRPKTKARAHATITARQNTEGNQ